MKYGKLLQLLLEQMPAEYRDKFLSYKQLKKVINTILHENSLPIAAFVEPDVDGEGVLARVVEVAELGVEPAAKRARGSEGESVATGGAVMGEERVGGNEAVAVGTKRKAGGGEADVETVPIRKEVAAREVLAAREVAVRAARVGEEKELSKEEENFLRLLNVELEKFNSFFTEKEEEYVIRLQVCGVAFFATL